MRRLRQLSESECYARCYGAADEAVRVIRLESYDRSRTRTVSGEELRRSLERKLDSRGPEADAA